MAALETPWITSMAPSPPKVKENGSLIEAPDQNPPTVAPFSPSQPSPTYRQRSTIMVHQKSPLLIATPPQVTRVLAFSHPFLLPLNRLTGLLTWSSGEPWESFLLVATFWVVVLYGDDLIRWSGPLMLVTSLIIAMYSRRYSPLSSTGWTGEKIKGHTRGKSEGSMRHQKSLDEIVDTLNVFTSRCNTLLDPFLQLTDFLSTQRTATSASTRPALTTLFLRILMVTPLWIAFTLPPLQVITSRRVILVIGTFALSWHSRPARVSRVILWRSLTIRYIISVITGLTLNDPLSTSRHGSKPPPLPPRSKNQHEIANSLVSDEESGTGQGVRFTFVVYENQRRWLGLGWTSSLFAYERAPWTDEHLNSSMSKEDFQLPEVDGQNARWRWVKGSEWRVEGARNSNLDNGKQVDAWIYYDNKWNDGRRGQDGWGRYTRRRKWYRDAELVEITQEERMADDNAPAGSGKQPIDAPPNYSQATQGGDSPSSGSVKRRGFLRRGSRASANSSSYSAKHVSGDQDEDDDRPLPGHLDRTGDWGVGDDIKMSMG